jgi:hypothetical protein
MGLREKPLPGFLVNVAFKGFGPAISLLFAALAGRFISVAAKELTGAYCWRKSNCLRWEDLRGVRRIAWRASIGTKGGEKSCRPNKAIIAH